jgi:hypothetical protein
MAIANMDPSDAKLISQSRAAAAARAAAENKNAGTPFGQAGSASVQAGIKEAQALKAKLEGQLATVLKAQVATAAAQGSSGDYTSIGSIMKNAEAYQAFKDARLERIQETRTQSAPATKSLTVGTPIPASPGLPDGRISIPRTPTPPSPTAPVPVKSDPVSPTTSSPAVKTAPIDTVLFNDDDIPIEVMSDLIFENIGGQELINIARSDIINGQTISYQPIKNLTSLQQQYNPNNILSVQSTSDKYFSNFAIKLENKTPNVGNGPFGSNVYIDTAAGSIVVDAINLESDEQIEIEIIVGGTIYEADLTGSES